MSPPSGSGAFNFWLGQDLTLSWMIGSLSAMEKSRCRGFTSRAAGHWRLSWPTRLSRCLAATLGSVWASNFMDSSRAALKRPAELEPKAVLNTWRRSIPPTDADYHPLPTERDKLTEGRRLYELILSYTFDLDESASVTPRFPALYGRLYA